MSKISVIIPMYNVEKYLKRCLDSILNQTFKDWTAICVDDGSHDKSGEIAEKYSKKDKRFVVIHKKNGGVSDARNVALKRVKTPYVMFLDSDDFVHPQTFEIVYNLAEKNKIDLIAFGLKNIKDSVKHFDVYPAFDYLITNNVLKYAAERDGIKSKYAIKRAYVCAKLYKTEFVKNILFPKNIKICEDFYWLSECYSKLPKTLILNTPLYYYFKNESSAVNSIKQVEFIRSVSVGIKQGIELFKDNKYSKLYTRNFIWPFIYSVVRTFKSIDNIKDKKIAIKYIKDICESCGHLWPYDLQSLKYYFRIKKILKLYS